MKKNENAPRGGEERSTVRRVLISVIGILVLLALLVLGAYLLHRAGYVTISFFKGDATPGGTDGNTVEAIGEIDAADGGRSDWFFDMSLENLRETMAERQNYVRSFRIVYSSGGLYRVEQLRLTRRGNCFRAESEERLLISDGERLYRKIGREESVVPASETSMYDELGITSAESLLQDGASDELSLSDDGKKINIRVYDDGYGMSGEYVLSVETGVVLTETNRLDGQTVRSVTTDYVDVLGADELPEDTFRIPNLQ